MNRLRRACAVGLGGLTLAIWLPTDDLARLIANQDEILLGRYSLDRFVLLGAVTLPCLWAAHLLAFPRQGDRRTRVFKLTALLLGLIPSLFLVDMTLRYLRSSRYVVLSIGPGQRIRQRHPDNTTVCTFYDVPNYEWEILNQPPGFGRVPIQLTTDAWGYRNPAVPERSRIVCIGDSFTEGANVSDRSCWPDLLRAQANQSVYNLGISAAAPPEYLGVLGRYALRLKPEIVVCMLFEGNDFRPASRRRIDRAQGVRGWVKSSPLRRFTNDSLVRLLGCFEPDLESNKGLQVLPILIPNSCDSVSRPYVFRPGALKNLYFCGQFRETPNWLDNSAVLEEMIEVCRSHDIQLVFVYAPCKTRVVLSLALGHIDLQGLREYAMWSDIKRTDTEQFEHELFDHLDEIESTVAQFCAERNVEFLSLTEPLRDGTEAGIQTYYTYDSHWTDHGHQIAAGEIIRFLASHSLGESARTPQDAIPSQ